VLQRDAGGHQRITYAPQSVAIGDAIDGHHHLVRRVGDTADTVRGDQRTGPHKRALGSCEARTHAQRELMTLGEDDRAQRQDLGAGRRQLDHFVERYLGDATRTCDDAGVGCIDAVDVCVDLADLRA
jgi:hypothetical protein